MRSGVASRKVPPHGHQGRRQVPEQIAEMKPRIRLLGNKGSVEGGEGEAREMVRIPALALDSEPEPGKRFRRLPRAIPTERPETEAA